MGTGPFLGGGAREELLFWTLISFRKKSTKSESDNLFLDLI